jgi:asparagine synthetase B (glutamine-hydrolysing)
MALMWLQRGCREPTRIFSGRLLLHLYQKHGSSMVQHLDKAIFAFVIFNRDRIFAAGDLLGIKTRFCGWKDDTLYIASEPKSLVEVADDIYAFPPGHSMGSTGWSHPLYPENCCNMQ